MSVTFGASVQILSVSSVSSLHEIGFICPPASSLSSKGKESSNSSKGWEDAGTGGSRNMEVQSWAGACFFLKEYTEYHL